MAKRKAAPKATVKTTKSNPVVPEHETCGGTRPYGPRRGGADGLEAMAEKAGIPGYGDMSRDELLTALKLEV